ncbi:hypothetical protein D3C72_1922780 [compost metagenome]
MAGSINLAGTVHPRVTSPQGNIIAGGQLAAAHLQRTAAGESDILVANQCSSLLSEVPLAV